MSSKDDDCVLGPSSSKSKPSGNCIVHRTDAIDNLVSLQSTDSREVLLKAAIIRQHEAVLKVASSLPGGAIPDIKYYCKCRTTFAMRKLLNNIKEKKNLP